TIRNLLPMASGAKYVQSYNNTGDTLIFNNALNSVGVERAAAAITVRAYAQGTKFNYASAESAILGAVVREATGESLSSYLAPRLWQAIGAENTAMWYADRTGLEVTLGNFNATLRDFGRLGVVLANDGVRPDDPARPQVVPRDFLLD